jgi:HNH endonuclease
MEASPSGYAWRDIGVPEVVGPRKQRFRGENYYLCGNYYQRAGLRLHRAVWEYFNGRPVPDGHHVHHRDGNKANNHPDNLELLTAAEHISHHCDPEAASERWHAGHGERMLGLAAEWHGTEAGKEWHRQHYLKMRDKLHEKKFTHACRTCGAEFCSNKPDGMYCSRNCLATGRRRSGVDDVDRECAICGTVFRVNRYARKQTCGRQCGTVLSWRNRREREGGRVLPDD